MLGVALGLTVALFLGCTDILATLAARRLGSMKAVFQAQVYGVLALLCFEGFAIWYWHVSLSPMALISSIVISIFTGMCAALGNFSLYRALAIGPVALVSPLLATSSIVTVLFSLFFLHEYLQPLQVICVTMVILGIALASIETTDIFRHAGAIWFSRGLAWALLATVAFGAMDFGIGASVAVSNWFLPLLWTRLFSLCFLTLLWWGRRAGVVPRTETMKAVSVSSREGVFQQKNSALPSPLDRSLPSPTRLPSEEVMYSSLSDMRLSTLHTLQPLDDDDEATLPRMKKITLDSASHLPDMPVEIPEEQILSLLRSVTIPRLRVVQVKKTPPRYALLTVALAGIMENIAILLFSFDTRIATTGITAAIASSYVLIVMSFGMLAYRERLTKHQWGGVILFMLGVVLLALYR